MKMITKYILYLLIILVNDCSSSPALLNRLRRHKAITFQSDLSSPIEFNINEGSKFRLTCSFLSSFDKIDIFWFHNHTLIESFISTNILEEEDDNVENSFLLASIISTIEIEKTHVDMNGPYKCIAMHNEIYSQQIFHIHVVASNINSIETNFSENTLVTVHTFQSLFEPRSQTSLMCRVGNNRKDKCNVQWFDPEDESLHTLNEETDLVLTNPNFEDNMGLYTCRICCHNQCQSLTAFVYPAGSEK
ncbi:unnamed protein product [Rotaria sordida]|uniref:Ig-like domain-containing protein n=1 Tax=Rotaria sordida TaxID=392033 RepID=A0A819LCZ3_9BILA|nr:unnamed protein product [Rotaria sordida]CAF3960167.1 unnamed protein product [Rotaria sordida]